MLYRPANANDQTSIEMVVCLLLLLVLFSFGIWVVASSSSSSLSHRHSHHHALETLRRQHLQLCRQQPKDPNSKCQITKNNATWRR